MGVYIKNWSLADWKELLKWAKIGANNAMIGEFTEVEEIPPHGRLVDADRLLPEHMKKKYYHLPNGDTAIPIIDVEHALTVIEADEVYGQYTDTAGNFHWCGTHSGEHTVKVEDGK